MTDSALPAAPTADHLEGMSYLETLPQRVVTTWIPLTLILIALPFLRRQSQARRR